MLTTPNLLRSLGTVELLNFYPTGSITRPAIGKYALRGNYYSTMASNPQAFISSYAPRLRAYLNSLLTPVIPPTAAQSVPLSRTTKRGTTAINYAENEYDDDDFEDSEGPRRPTGLRSRREDPSQVKEQLADRLGKELSSPTEVQGIWRDWMGKPKLVRYIALIIYSFNVCWYSFFNCLGPTSSSMLKPHYL